MSGDADELRLKIASAARWGILRARDPESAVRMITEAMLVLIDELVIETLPDPATQRVHHARRRRRALDLLAAEGHGRNAARRVAAAIANDPENPLEVENLAQQIRRWHREANTVRPD